MELYCWDQWDFFADFVAKGKKLNQNIIGCVSPVEQSSKSDVTTSIIDKLWIWAMGWCHKYCGCHQIPNRSFFIGSYQFPLCARCTGILIGNLGALLFFHFFTLTNPVLIALLLPLMIDGALQQWAQIPSTNLRRLLSGLLYGYSLMTLILKALLKLLAFATL